MLNHILITSVESTVMIAIVLKRWCVDTTFIKIYGILALVRSCHVRERRITIIVVLIISLVPVGGQWYFHRQGASRIG